MDPSFFNDAFAMGIHGGFTDKQPRSDLPAFDTMENQGKYFFFTIRQRTQHRMAKNFTRPDLYGTMFE